MPVFNDAQACTHGQTNAHAYARREMPTHTYKYAHAHTNTHTLTHTHAQVHTKNTHTNTHTHTHTVLTRILISHACLHTHTCIQTNTNTHTHTHREREKHTHSHTHVTHALPQRTSPPRGTAPPPLAAAAVGGGSFARAIYRTFASACVCPSSHSRCGAYSHARIRARITFDTPFSAVHASHFARSTTSQNSLRVCARGAQFIQPHAPEETRVLLTAAGERSRLPWPACAAPAPGRARASIALLSPQYAAARKKTPTPPSYI